MAREEQKKKVNNNVTYRFILQPYRGPSSREECPNCGGKHCYARYVDIETGEVLDSKFGRCDRVEKCGYFLSPYGKDVTDKPLMIHESKVKKEFHVISNYISLIPQANLIESLTLKDNFSKFILNNFPHEKAVESLLKYKVGESDKWDGATIFWQVDHDMDVRTGKIILYDDNCKRVKTPYSKISWAHTPEKDLAVIPNYNLKQCMFGEHLINNNIKNYNIVEAEKTAIICDIVNKDPDTVWLSVGGIELINEEKLQVLEGKNLTFYPDKGDKAYSKWKSKLNPLMGDWNIRINRGLERTKLEDGADLADLILSKLKK